MPVTIQLTGLKYKNSQGQFQSADCLKGEDADISIIAPDYSELTFPVNAGKLCTHDLKLYRAKQGIPTSENWTESHWDERTIEEELAAKYTKPAGGIPASDLADGVIPDIIDDEAGAGDTDVTFSADKLTSEFDALSNALNQSNAATNSDIGKAHSPKTVVDGHVTEWQYVEVGGGGGGEMSDEEKLLQSNLPGTSQTVAFANSKPASITHSANGSAVRTDTFVWGTGTVTETRTLANGKYITIETNLTTLATTVSAVQEAA